MPLDNDFWRDEAMALYRVLFPLVRQAAQTAAENGITALGADISVNWELVNEAAREWAEAYSYELVTGITDTSRAFLQDALSEWIESGDPLDELISTIDESGFFGPVRSQMIAETEVTRAFAEGNLIGWRESGAVSGKRWRTGMDELVCPICAPLEGEEVALDDVFSDGNGEQHDGPPAHVRCRCWIQPVVRATA